MSDKYPISSQTHRNWTFDAFFMRSAGSRAIRFVIPVPACGRISGTGSGQETTQDWIILQGTVTNKLADSLAIDLKKGGTLKITNRSWRFAQEQSFTTEVSHHTTVKGFYEDSQEFEVGHITDLNAGESVALREENSLPLWAGRGRGV